METITQHDLMQWLAFAGGIGTLFWHIQRRDAARAMEIRRQAEVGHRLDSLESRFIDHVNRDTGLPAKIDEILHDVRDIRERLVRLETQVGGG